MPKIDLLMGLPDDAPADIVAAHNRYKDAQQAFWRSVIGYQQDVTQRLVDAGFDVEEKRECIICNGGYWVVSFWVRQFMKLRSWRISSGYFRMSAGNSPPICMRSRSGMCLRGWVMSNTLQHYEWGWPLPNDA